MDLLLTSRYESELKFPLKLKCALVVGVVLLKLIGIGQCTVDVEPVVVDEGGSLDKLLTRIGLKNTIVQHVGQNPEDKTFFGEDENGTPTVVGTWFTYGSYTLAMCIFGTAFLASAAATAIYYVLFVVTEPSQLLRKKRSNEISKEDSISNVSRIMNFIYLAFEAYEKLDLYDQDCQKKILCELQQGNDTAAKATRQISTFLTYLDILDARVPNMKEFRDAVKVGQNSKNCEYSFQNCKFSMADFNSKFKNII